MDGPYIQMVSEVADEINARQPARVTVAGHSLGGAVANLFGSFIANSTIRSNVTTDVVTFGAPQVGTPTDRQTGARMEAGPFCLVLPHLALLVLAGGRRGLRRRLQRQGKWRRAGRRGADCSGPEPGGMTLWCMCVP